MPLTGGLYSASVLGTDSDLGDLGKMTRIRLLSRVALAAAVLSAAACTASESEDKPASLSEVRIGVLVPKSGKSAAAGAQALHGAELAVALVNGDEGGPVQLAGVGSGGLAGVGGAKLAIVAGDTKSSPEAGTSEAVRLVTQERVAGLVGAYDAAVTKAASQRTERLSIPFVNGDSPADFLTERGLDWFFRTGPTDRMFGEAFYSTLQREEEVRPTRISMLYTTDTNGESLHRVLHNLAPEANYQEHGMVKFEQGQPDLVTPIQKLRDEKKPEVLFVMTSTGSDAVRVLKTMETMGYRPPQIFAFGDAFSEPQVLQAAGTAGEGLYYGTAWSREIAGRSGIAKAVMERYEERFGQPMGEVAAESFTAVLALAEAIDSAGSTDPQRVRTALLNLDIPGRETIMPWTGIRFDASHQNAAANGVVEQRVQDAFRVVFPDELQQARPVGQAAGAGTDHIHPSG
jgi:branched-chain amino acid transport system substrate-binding protein